ncbi:MAG: hypothetical protein PHE49_01740 [bacterium]|nr:hypothetical protein [bacterium]
MYKKIREINKAVYLLLGIVLIEIIERVVDKLFGSGDGTIACFGINHFVFIAQAILLIIAIIIIIEKNKIRIDKKNILLATVVSLFMLLICEFALFLLGIQSISNLYSKIPKTADFFVSDSIEGSYFVKEKLPGGEKFLCKEFFNNQGFRDKDEFVASNIDTSLLRILLLGDSFTLGLEAICDGSDGYGDIAEKRLKALLWNTGIIGIGQKQELHMLKKYYPMLKPQYVILGFYDGNDWNDNLYPMGISYWFNLEGRKEKVNLINRYKLLPGESIRILSPKEAWGRAYPPYSKSSNEIISFLEKSRVISLCINASRNFVKDFKTTSTSLKKYHRLKNPSFQSENFLLTEPSPDEFNKTLNLFRQIKDYVDANNSKLVILIIPHKYEIEKRTKSEHYTKIIDICKTLTIDYMEVFDELSYSDYYEWHWNKSGHLKVGNLLAERIQKDEGSK